MYQPLIKFHPHPAIITQVLRIFEVNLENKFLGRQVALLCKAKASVVASNAYFALPL